MALFRINGSKVKKIIAKNLDLEKNLQNIFEKNLDEILDISFLAHEYTTSFGGRIDTLGVDKDGSPCIIEYKRGQNDNVINQGLSYLRWLLDHKADFEMLCIENGLKIEVGWKSPRVICVAESYSKFDLDTADILPINVELLRYRLYEDSVLNVEPENYQKVNVSIRGAARKNNTQTKGDTLLQKVFTLEEHVAGADANTKEIFFDLRERVTALDQSILEEPKAKYIAYKTTTNFVDVVVLHSSLKVFLNVKSGQLSDPLQLARDLVRPKKVGHWGNGDYEIKIDDKSQMEDVFALVKQSYDMNR